MRESYYDGCDIHSSTGRLPVRSLSDDDGAELLRRQIKTNQTRQTKRSRSLAEKGKMVLPKKRAIGNNKCAACTQWLPYLCTFLAGMVLRSIVPDVVAVASTTPTEEATGTIPMPSPPGPYVPRTKIGEHEIILVSLIASLFREDHFMPPGGILDAGAQFGEQAAYYAKLAPGRTVHAVDPSPRNIDKIEKTYKAALPNLKIHQVGLGSTVGVRRTPKDAGFNMDHGSEFRVETLDSLFFDRGEPLGFAHLDVEGLELQVLEGSVNTLTTYQPIVTTELRVHDNATYTTLLLTFLDQLGYDTYVIDEVCGYPYMDYRNLLNIPRTLSRNLPFSDAFNLALATDAIFRVNASSIATLVYPCCAAGGDCCPDPNNCCREDVVNQWLEDHHVHRPAAMQDFKGARRATTMRWRALRIRFHNNEFGTRR
jgi:FkbM family methyltransferase